MSSADLSIVAIVAILVVGSVLKEWLRERRAAHEKWRQIDAERTFRK